MPRQINAKAVRYLGSFALIFLGVAMIALVLSGGLDSSAGENQDASTTSIQARAKGTPEDCPANWRFVDNPQDRFTICLPVNLQYYDGTTLTDLNLISSTWPSLFTNFVVVNEPHLAPPPADAPRPENPALAPITLKVEVVGVDESFGRVEGIYSGCELRKQVPDKNGIVSCTDTYDFAGDQIVFSSAGSKHTLKALIPTLPGKSVQEVFSVYVNIDGTSVDWPNQQSMFWLIIDSITSY